MGIRILALVLAAPLVAGPAAAQTFPTKQVRIIVGLTAGGTTDLVARIVNQPDHRERLVNLGVDLIAGTPDEFAAYLRAEIARLRE